MEQELLRRVQLTLLEIAVEIKRVCEENDIRYFLPTAPSWGQCAIRASYPGMMIWTWECSGRIMRNSAASRPRR